MCLTDAHCESRSDRELNAFLGERQLGSNVRDEPYSGNSDVFASVGARENQAAKSIFVAISRVPLHNPRCGSRLRRRMTGEPNLRVILWGGNPLTGRAFRYSPASRKGFRLAARLKQPNDKLTR